MIKSSCFEDFRDFPKLFNILILRTSPKSFRKYHLQCITKMTCPSDIANVFQDPFLISCYIRRITSRVTLAKKFAKSTLQHFLRQKRNVSKTSLAKTVRSFPLQDVLRQKRMFREHTCQKFLKL